MDSEKITKKWERKRLYTFIGFILQSMCNGMEFSVTFTTLWVYLTKVIKVENPNLFYGLISSIYALGCLISSPFVGRYADKHKNIRELMILSNLITVVGNIFYALEFSPWFLFFGRLLSGVGLFSRPIMYGETAKCYRKSEIASKYFALGTICGVGAVSGPMLNNALQKINIFIGKWHIESVNVVGVYMACLFFCLLIANSILISNVSKEFDIKELETQEEENELTSPYLKTEDTGNNFLFDLKVLISQFDIALIFVMSCFSWSLSAIYESWTSLIIIDTLQWSYASLNTAVTFKGAASVSFFFCLMFVKSSDGGLYFIGVFSFVAVITGPFIIYLLSFFNLSASLEILSVGIYCILFPFVEYMEYIYLPNILSKMVNSNMTSYAESLRSCVARIGASIGFLFSGYLYEYINYTGIVIIIVALCLQGMVAFRRANFVNPTISKRH